MKRYLVLGLILGFTAAISPAGAMAAEDNAMATEIEALEEAAAEAVSIGAAATDEEQLEAAADEGGTFEVGRVVVAEAVVEHEPAGATDLFPAEADKAYVFLEARDIVEDTEANFVWYRDDAEVARVALRLGQGPRWRTYSSKNINGLPGDWKVDVQDPGGNVLKTVAFRVE